MVNPPSTARLEVVTCVEVTEVKRPVVLNRSVAVVFCKEVTPVAVKLDTVTVPKNVTDVVADDPRLITVANVSLSAPDPVSVPHFKFPAASVSMVSQFVNVPTANVVAVALVPVAVVKRKVVANRSLEVAEVNVLMAEVNVPEA